METETGFSRGTKDRDHCLCTGADARGKPVDSSPPELKHATLTRYNRFIRPMYDIVCSTQLDTMAVIREPISWMRSWYRYRQRPFLNGKPASTQGISFDTFVSGYLQPTPPAYAHIGSQARFIMPRSGTPPITYLFRYENQARLRAFLEHRLETRIEVPQRLASNRVKLIGRCCSRSRRETPSRL